MFWWQVSCVGDHSFKIYLKFFKDKKIAELEESFNSKIEILELQEKRLVRELDESKNQNKLQAQSISENKEITSNMETEIGALKNQIKTMANAKGGFQNHGRWLALSAKILPTRL